MTFSQALYKFWAGFGIPAYEENSVPENAQFPYITYELSEASGFGDQIALTASIWYRSPKWTEINLKAYEIMHKIGSNGLTLPCDNGIAWINTGIPFAQNMGDDSDELIRRKYINLMIEFLR